MFTPPPSPLPIPVAGDMLPPPPTLTLSTPGKESGYLLPNVSPSAVDPKSPASAEAGRERIAKGLKRKQSGRRILLAVALLPAVLILSAILRHFTPCLRSHLRVEHSGSTLITKREPQSSTDPDAPDGEVVGQGVANAGLTPSVTVVSGDVPAIPSDPALPTPFPQPFDTLSANFSTAGCQAFFQNFTQDENFRQCRSFSFLLSASSSFLTAQRNLTLINNIIYGTCNTRPTIQTCDSRMSTYLSQLGDVCATEISNQNPTVLQAQVAFQSYTAMRSAACLEDVSSQRYCYVEALAANDPQDIYYWALPLGTGIPEGVNPTCGACVQSVLAVYSQYVDSAGKTGPSALPSGGQTSGNSTTVPITPSPLPALSKAYPQAARLAVQQCGGTFANVGIADSGASQMAPRLGATLSIGLLLSCWISFSF